MKKHTCFFGVNCLLAIVFFSCTNYKLVEEDNFLGTWELQGRSMYNGMQIRILKENNKLKGYIITVPSNKYGQMFLDSAMIWVSQIERVSNYSFRFQEQKIASELFSAYGMGTTTTYYATFSAQKDKIFLTDKNPENSKESEIYYERINHK